MVYSCTELRYVRGNLGQMRFKIFRGREIDGSQNVRNLEQSKGLTERTAGAGILGIGSKSNKWFAFALHIFYLLYYIFLCIIFI